MGKKLAESLLYSINEFAGEHPELSIHLPLEYNENGSWGFVVENKATGRTGLYKTDRKTFDKDRFLNSFFLKGLAEVK